MSDATEYDAVIVGGGLAGLAAGWRLRHRRILLLEAEQRLGGRLMSSPRGPYWLNFGAHMFGGPQSPVGELVSAMGLEARPIGGSLMGVAYKGKMVAGGRAEMFPLRLPLSLAARISFIRMGLKLKRGSEALLATLKLRPGESPAEQRVRGLAFLNEMTLSDYVGPLHPEIEALLETITQRTSSSPDVMAAGYGLTSFTNVWSAHAPGRNLVGGSGLLPEALGRALGDSIRTGAEVIEVGRQADGAHVSFVSNRRRETVLARQVILATPAAVTRRIGTDLPTDLLQALGEIRYGAFLSVAVLTGESEPMPWDGSYAIATPGLAFGVLFNQATTVRQGPRQSGGSLMLFCGARLAEKWMDRPDREIITAFKADLERLFPVSGGVIREMVVQRWPHGAPYARPGRAALQPRLTQPLDRIVLAGDYLEFPNMEAAVKTGNEAADIVEARLGDIR